MARALEIYICSSINEGDQKRNDLMVVIVVDFVVIVVTAVVAVFVWCCCCCFCCFGCCYVNCERTTSTMCNNDFH